MARTGIEDKLSAFGELSREQLTERWRKRFGCLPPTGVRMPLLLRAAAWQEQERALGGFSISTKRLLKAVVKDAEEKFGKNQDMEDGEGRGKNAGATSGSDEQSSAELCVQVSTRPQPRRSVLRSMPVPGARLIREWNGKRYIVDVVDDGYLMEKDHYTSLTAIAFAITGTRWSGPRFFSL